MTPGITYRADGPDVVVVTEGNVCRVTLKRTIAEAEAEHAALGAAIAAVRANLIRA